jgi:hypothetical protein
MLSGRIIEPAAQHMNKIKFPVVIQAGRAAMCCAARFRGGISLGQSTMGCARRLLIALDHSRLIITPPAGKGLADTARKNVGPSLRTARSERIAARVRRGADRLHGGYGICFSPVRDFSSCSAIAESSAQSIGRQSCAIRCLSSRRRGDAASRRQRRPSFCHQGARALYYRKIMTRSLVSSASNGLRDHR